MTNYRRGDIIFGKFPFSDGTGFKKRPALVISTNEYNESRSDIMIMPITSQLTSVDSFEIRNWDQVGLRHPSEIRYKIATIPQSFIIRRLGHLNRGPLKAVTERIAEKIGIT